MSLTEPDILALHRPAAVASSRGQVLVLFALFLVVLVGAAGLAVDYSSWLVARRNYQNVADQAALAGAPWLAKGAMQAACSGSGLIAKQTCARTAAWKALHDQLGVAYPPNYTTQDLANVTVTAGDGSAYQIWVTTPPNTGLGYTGKYAGDTQKIWVQVQRPSPAYFSRIFGLTDATITATATAGNALNRWAVITLCRDTDPNRPQCRNSDAQDIKVSGTNTVLRIIDGDAGGNFHAVVDGGAQIQLPPESDGTNNYLYLIDPSHQTGGSWSAGEINDGSGNLLAPLTLPDYIQDPGYPEGTYPTIQQAAVNVPNNGSQTIDPGAYGTIKVGNNGTLNLNPGVYYIRQKLDLNQGTVTTGDRVTIVMNADTVFAMGSGATMRLNLGSGTPIPPQPIPPQWTTPSGTPISLYLVPRHAGTNPLKPTGTTISGGETSIVNWTSGATLEWAGYVYGPADNMTLTGQPGNNNIGQLVCWTVKFSGGATFIQKFNGPSQAFGILYEPALP